MGIVIGIQLFFWSISGAYFSWNAIKKVRGEDMLRAHETIDLRKSELISLNDVIKSSGAIGDSELKLVFVTVTTVLDRPVYELTFEGKSEAGESGKSQFALIDAISGKRLSPIGEVMACKIALADFAEDVEVQSAKLIHSTTAHSEYRGKELPAWRIVLNHPTGTVIYVSADRGTVTTRRNNRWRIFDFLWMLHTMDYQGRDNFNHWLLKGASVFGIVTVLSGFGLWFKTSRLFRRRKIHTNSEPDSS